MQIEFLAAHESGTWDTYTFEVPEEHCSDEQSMTNWCLDYTAEVPAYQNYMLWAVYSIPAQEEKE